MQPLQTLIDILSKQRKVHISFLDLTGILDTPTTKVAFKHKLHSNSFCDVAKSTYLGRRICIRCKRLANKKATQTKRPFGGHCSYGLYEVAFPVVIGESVAAVVYVGNAVIKQELTNQHINKVCKFTGIDEKTLCKHLSDCEYLPDSQELFQIAEIVADYLKAVYKKSPKQSHGLHWIVYELKRYAECRFWTDISLQEIAYGYNKNEKYLGRLFKKELGMNFHQYCMQLRMEKAETLLVQSADKILDIALNCGFNNVSYFNRIFFKKHGVSPTKYRALNDKND